MEPRDTVARACADFIEIARDDDLAVGIDRQRSRRTVGAGAYASTLAAPRTMSNEARMQ
jgi:hypothetical protein